MDAADYDDGRGKVRLRARIDVADEKTLIIREIPYSTTTEGLIQSIEAAAQKGKVKVSRIDDRTAEEVEIVVHLQRGVYADEVEPQLYAYTQCEVSISSNLVLIQDDRPGRAQRHRDFKRTHRVSARADPRRARARAHGARRQAALPHPRADLHREPRLQEDRKPSRRPRVCAARCTRAWIPTANSSSAKWSTMTSNGCSRFPSARISLYDINKSRQDLDDIVRAIADCEKKLKQLTRTTIKYLEGVIKKFGGRLSAAYRDRRIRAGLEEGGGDTKPEAQLRPQDGLLSVRVSRGRSTR